MSADWIEIAVDGAAMPAYAVVPEHTRRSNPPKTMPPWTAAAPPTCALDSARAPVAAIGFCLGGSLAFVMAESPAIDAATIFYGGNVAQPWREDEPAPLSRADAAHAPLLLLYGGEDPYIPRADVETIRRGLADAGMPFSLHVYDHAGHGFFRRGPDADRRPPMRGAG